MKYSASTVDELLQHFSSKRDGLTSAEADSLLKTHGRNELPKKRRSRLKMFLLQFASPLVFILFGAVAISLAIPLYEYGHLTTEDLIDPIAIMVILILNAFFGFFQELKAENTLEALKEMQPEKITVLRDFQPLIIESSLVVPGDIVILAEGDKVAADMRLVEAVELNVIEAALTGESQPTHKDAKWQGDGTTGDLKNMVFAGTQIASGRGIGLVVATGIKTELGKIAKMVSETISPPTPLERRLDKLGKKIGGAVVFLCILVFGIAVLKDTPFTEALFTAVALAVSAVPEGLPAVMTISLAVGVAIMAKRNALVRELKAVETLGSVNVVCSDKTGTITENKMRVVAAYGNERHFVQETLDRFADSPTGKQLLDAIASCNDAELPDIGDPTEIGLLQLAAKFHIGKRERIDEIPFSSDKKWMSTTHLINDVKTEYIKGAPEVVAKFCAPEVQAKIEAAATKMAEQGLRTIGIALRKDGAETAEFLGILGLLDPPRATVKSAIIRAKEAGIRTVMITGDHAITAQAIAHQVGLEGDVLSGTEIEKMSPAALKEAVIATSIFARVSPEHKVRICKALQSHGLIVAMTGDGVNDAPALQSAQIGISMGKVGTSVAREASDLILLDDKFDTIVAGIEEGRRIFSNIKKSVSFLLRTNFMEVVVILVAVVAGIPLPLLPIHILFLNLLTDAFPVLALAAEAPEKNIMKQPPRPIKEGFLTGQTKYVLGLGALGATVTLIVFLSVLDQIGESQAQSLALATIVMIELTLIYSIRRNIPVWKEKGAFTENPWVFGAVSVSLLLFLISLYTPLSGVMQLEPFPHSYWEYPLIAAAVVFAFSELMKWAEYRTKDKNTLYSC